MTDEDREAIELVINNGFLRIERNDAYVHPDFWNELTYDRKRGFAFGLSKYCAELRNEPTMGYVNIYDMYSGKKIAYYGSWGFKVY